MIAGGQSPTASISDNVELRNLQNRNQDAQKEYEEFIQFTKEQQLNAPIEEDLTIQKVR